MGVPLATDHISGAIHADTGSELITNRLEEIEERKEPERERGLRSTNTPHMHYADSDRLISPLGADYMGGTTKVAASPNHHFEEQIAGG